MGTSLLLGQSHRLDSAKAHAKATAQVQAPEPITPSRHPAVSRHSGTSLSGLTTWVSPGALSGTVARRKYPANGMADGCNVPGANALPHSHLLGRVWAGPGRDLTSVTWSFASAAGHISSTDFQRSTTGLQNRPGDACMKTNNRLRYFLGSTTGSYFGCRLFL